VTNSIFQQKTIKILSCCDRICFARLGKNGHGKSELEISIEKVPFCRGRDQSLWKQSLKSMIRMNPQKKRVCYLNGLKMKNTTDQNIQ